MKRSRFSTRDRHSKEAAELQRLATSLSDSGGKLEDAFLEAQLVERLDSLLSHGGEDDINTALNQMFDANPQAHDELADMVESRAESHTLEFNGQAYEIMLFSAPIHAWSRFSIPTCNLPANIVKQLGVQLGAHVFSRDARIALCDFLFSPDQLPRSFCDTHALTRSLGDAAIAGNTLAIDPKALPETNRFLSDLRYLIGVIAVPHGAPLFRWHEADGTREAAQHAWASQGGPVLESLFTGCAWEMRLPDAFHTACRTADRQSRAYSLRAAAAFLETMLGLIPADIQVVIGPCYERELEEFRISFGPKEAEDVYHGVVWPLVGAEDESTDTLGEIESTLRQIGVTDIRFLDHHFPLEFCDDCSAPLFPNVDGELIHAELPEALNGASLTMH